MKNWIIPNKFHLDEFRADKAYKTVEQYFTQEDRHKIFYLCKMYLEPARDMIEKSIWISSGKRTLRWNQKWGGSENSDHLFREECAAVDFFPLVWLPEGREAGLRYRSELIFTIRSILSGGKFGQLILYIDQNANARFIHISLPSRRHYKEVFELFWEDLVCAKTRKPAQPTETVTVTKSVVQPAKKLTKFVEDGKIHLVPK